MKKLLLFLAITIFSACSTYNGIKIDILAPSAYHIPSTVEKIVILTNADEQKPEVGHSTYQNADPYGHFRRSKKLSTDTIKVDSAAISALRSMYNQIEESQFFSSVEIAEVNKSSVSNTFTNHPADALLILEKLKYTDKLNHTRLEYFNIDETELAVVVSSKWSLYYSDNSIAPYTFTHTDSLFWNQESIDRPDCIIESIWDNSKNSSKHIIPHWVTVDRLYYKNIGFVSKEINKSIEEQNWDKAAKLWMALYNGEKKESLKKAKMAFNMALFFEMKNDMDTALMWLEIASDIFTAKQAINEDKMCTLYSEVLNKRLHIQEKLDQQLGL